MANNQLLAMLKDMLAATSMLKVVTQDDGGHIWSNRGHVKQNLGYTYEVQENLLLIKRFLDHWILIGMQVYMPIK